MSWKSIKIQQSGISHSGEGRSQRSRSRVPSSTKAEFRYWSWNEFIPIYQYYRKQPMAREGNHDSVSVNDREHCFRFKTCRKWGRDPKGDVSSHKIARTPPRHEMKRGTFAYGFGPQEVPLRLPPCPDLSTVKWPCPGELALLQQN